MLTDLLPFPHIRLRRWQRLRRCHINLSRDGPPDRVFVLDTRQLCFLDADSFGIRWILYTVGYNFDELGISVMCV